MRIALCFPGQGSQQAGMAEGLLETSAAAEMLEAATELGLDLRPALLAADDAALRPTEVAQPALLLVECALASLLPAGLDVVATAGHSVGEYAACVAAGALTAPAAMRLVVERGRAMARMREGTMAALLGLDADAAAEICASAARDSGEVVVVANHNGPGQVVVSGASAGVAAAIELARQRGARRAVPLPVSGAFHSPLMEEAGSAFAACLRDAPLRPADVPVVANVDAEPVRDPEALRQRLVRQLTAPVLWTGSVRRLVELGAEVLLELGPGSVLTGLARRIAPEVRALSVTTPAQLGELRALTGAAA